MPNDIPPPIKYTARVRRGFGYILSEETCPTAQARKDADLAVAWMEQEHRDQMKWDNARAATKDPLPCPSIGSSPPAEKSNPTPST